MWRVLGVVEDMGQTLADASAQLAAVIHAIDAEMGRLHERLDADARALNLVIEKLHISEEQQHEVEAVLQRIEATALHISKFTHRPADAEQQIAELLRDPRGRRHLP